MAESRKTFPKIFCLQFVQDSDDRKVRKRRRGQRAARAVNSTTCVCGLLTRVYAYMQMSPVRLLCKIYDRSMLMEIVNISTRILIGCR